MTQKEQQRSSSEEKPRCVMCVQIFIEDERSPRGAWLVPLADDIAAARRVVRRRPGLHPTTGAVGGVPTSRASTRRRVRSVRPGTVSGIATTSSSVHRRPRPVHHTIVVISSRGATLRRRHEPRGARVALRLRRLGVRGRFGGRLGSVNLHLGKLHAELEDFRVLQVPLRTATCRQDDCRVRRGNSRQLDSSGSARRSAH